MRINCLNPQFVSRPGGAERILPCGQCYNCRRKVVRKWQGMAVCEQRFPYYPDQGDPQMQHFFTLTYAKTPMTVPQKHELGKILDAEGEEIGAWNGPFFRKDPRTRDGKKREGVSKRGSIPVWHATGDPLTASELAEEHERYLRYRLGWSSDQLNRWLEGDYDPEPTTRFRDAQQFLDRLRKWNERNADSENPIRYLLSTEYGGANGRPHWHVLLFGLDADNAEMVHHYWEDFREEFGFVNPDLYDTIINRASVMRDRAATYQAKDLVKARHLFQGTPGMYEVEKPRVVGSRRPPIGDGAYSWWMETWIQKVIRKAEQVIQPGDDREFILAKYVAANLSQLPIIPTGQARSQTFPTPRKWRERCREDLGISEELWKRVQDFVELQEQDMASKIRNNEDGIGDDFDGHIGELRRRADENLEREKRRTEAKRAALISAGKLRPGG